MQGARGVHGLALGTQGRRLERGKRIDGHIATVHQSLVKASNHLQGIALAACVELPLERPPRRIGAIQNFCRDVLFRNVLQKHLISRSLLQRYPRQRHFGLHQTPHVKPLHLPSVTFKSPLFACRQITPQPNLHGLVVVVCIECIWGEWPERSCAAVQFSGEREKFQGCYSEAPNQLSRGGRRHSGTLVIDQFQGI